MIALVNRDYVSWKNSSVTRKRKVIRKHSKQLFKDHKRKNGEIVFEIRYKKEEGGLVYKLAWYSERV